MTMRIMMLLLPAILHCVMEQTWLAGPITLGDGGAFQKVSGRRRGEKVHRDGNPASTSAIAVGLWTVPQTDGLGIRTGSAGAC